MRQVLNKKDSINTLQVCFIDVAVDDIDLLDETAAGSIRVSD